MLCTVRVEWLERHTEKFPCTFLCHWRINLLVSLYRCILGRQNPSQNVRPIKLHVNNIWTYSRLKRGNLWQLSMISKGELDFCVQARVSQTDEGLLDRCLGDSFYTWTLCYDSGVLIWTLYQNNGVHPLKTMLGRLSTSESFVRTTVFFTPEKLG